MVKSNRMYAVAAALLAIGNATSAYATSLVTSPVSGQGTWETTLQARDLDGNPATVEAYYDSVLNITWLAEADYFAYSSSVLDWSGVNSLAGSLDINGVTGWRLPTMVDTGSPGCDFASSGTDCGYNVQTTSGSTVYSEMATMYYDTLGNTTSLTNTGPFSIWTTAAYWTGLTNALDSSQAWYFDFSNGAQGADLTKTSNVPFAWFVHDGSVGTSMSAVPLPASLWLFGSGLAVLAGMTGKKKSPA